METKLIAYCHIGIWMSNLRYHFLKFVIFLLLAQCVSDNSEKLDFWWSIAQKQQVLVILVPGIIKPSGSVNFLMKWGCWGHWGYWGCWGCWGHWGSRGSKAWKITTEEFKVIHVIKFSFFWMFWKEKVLGRLTKYHFEF